MVSAPGWLAWRGQLSAVICTQRWWVMGLDCGRAHFRHEAATRAALVGALGQTAWRERCGLAGVRWRLLTVCNPSQLYCYGVQWVTFKFNLKF
ncbi:hypothetical protein DW645_05405 [Collinsella sp. AM23-17]|nr:hypothetical protein DW645_05405 [Collinsella sp. AM23-17]RHM64628.1 hypothetical protein DWZ52_00790 [Collinsella sp. AF33-16]